MDFVQRNLINERNNLQIELAKAKALIAELQETYRITPVRRDLLNKIQSTAMRDAADAMGPDGEDFRASSIKKSDGALSRISRIELMKMKGKPSDKRTHDQHPMHRFFPDDRSPNQLTDRALNADLAAERKREISNRPKKKNKLNEQDQYISDLENVIATIAEQLGVHPNDLLNEYNINEARVMTSRGVRRQRKFTTVESRRKEAEDKLVKNPNERQDETAGLVPVSAAHNAAYAAVRAHGGINSDKLNTDMNALKSHEFARKHAITDAKRRQLDRVSGLSGLRGQQEKQMAKRKDPVFTRDLENYIGSTTPNKFRKDSVETMIKNKYNPLTKTKLKPGNILDISKNRSELFKNINKKK